MDNLILTKKEAWATSWRRVFVTQLSSVERRQVTHFLYTTVKFPKQLFNLWLFQNPNYPTSTDLYLHFYGEKEKKPVEIGAVEYSLSSWEQEVYRELETTAEEDS